MFAACENFQFTVTPGGAVGCGELFLSRWQHIVVQFTLHNQQRPQGYRIAAIKNFLWIAFVDGFPWIEIIFSCIAPSPRDPFSRRA